MHPCHHDQARKYNGGPGKTDHGLPELIVSGSDPTATAKELAALIAKRDDFLFNGHAPIRVAAEADCLPRALEVTTEMVRILAHEISIPTKVRIMKGTKGKVGRTPAPLSKDIAQLYLHGLEGSWGLKPFRGIVTAPILSGDGSIRSASGYDARSGLWCHNIPNITVPANPTKSDAERALRKLRQFFRTFPFADAMRLTDPDLGIEYRPLQTRRARRKLVPGRAAHGGLPSVARTRSRLPVRRPQLQRRGHRQGPARQGHLRHCQRGAAVPPSPAVTTPRSSTSG